MKKSIAAVIVGLTVASSTLAMDGKTLTSKMQYSQLEVMDSVHTITGMIHMPSVHREGADSYAKFKMGPTVNDYTYIVRTSFYCYTEMAEGKALKEGKTYTFEAKPFGTRKEYVQIPTMGMVELFVVDAFCKNFR